MIQLRASWNDPGAMGGKVRRSPRLRVFHTYTTAEIRMATANVPKAVTTVGVKEKGSIPRSAGLRKKI